MEKRQLVSRKQLDSDHRRNVVSLEPKGLRLIALHAPDSERIYAEIAKRFGDERVSHLFALLHELQGSLEEMLQESERSQQRANRKTAYRSRKRRDQ
jgi:DNA-binding MarR family transcriptional regulator